jgi:DNA mismatch repair ATPase MutL
MQDLSLHILDIAENSIAAGARNIEISLVEDIEGDVLTLEIEDDGVGMDEEMARKAADPFVTTRRERRVGLGLSLLEQAAEMANGKLEITSKQGKGTRVRATFQYSHIDRKPLGNLQDTLITLICANPEINITFYHKWPLREVRLSTEEMKGRLGQSQLDYIDAAREVRKLFQ